MTVVNDPGRKRSHPASNGSSAYLSRWLTAAVRHSADLTALADDGPHRWTDRWRAEARFHLAAMMNAIEQAIVSTVADSPTATLLGALGPGYCRHAIEREMGLLSPDFIDHLRQRAAIATLLRQADDARWRRVTPALTQQMRDTPHEEALTRLTSAEQGWHPPMLLDAAMVPDLPAEPFHELAWSVAALLVQGCARQPGADEAVATKSIVQATERMIARHDEADGVTGLVRRFARALPPETRVSLAPAALTDARLLLFAALAESAIGLPLDVVIDALLDPDDAPRHAIFRLMRIDDATVFRAGELLGWLTGAGAEDDEALARFVESYRRVDQAQAAHWLEAMLRPSVLAGKLALMAGDP
ncbi:MAG TPA: hypothetical protein VNS79_05055 [Sphingobium sp.]|nr:hypothetical protein [Sphingobium sp.]